MKTYLMALANICVCAWVLLSCSSKVTPPSQNFMDAYIELGIVSEVYGTRIEAALLRRDILKKYGFTRESFNDEANRLRSDYRLWQEYETLLENRLDSLASLHAKERRLKPELQGKHFNDSLHKDLKLNADKKRAALERKKAVNLNKGH